MSMSKRQIDIVFAATAIIIVCLLMAAMSGCEDKEAEVTAGFVETGTGEAIVIVSSDGKDCPLCDAGSGPMCPHGGIDMLFDPPKIEVGQIWESETENPFDVHVQRKILALQSGYVKYKRVDVSGVGITGSMPDEVFCTVADKLVDDPNVLREPAVPRVWGKGELPVEHQDFFGNDNTARLDYVQNRVLDKHGAILKIIAIRVLALEAVDPNAMRLEALESGMEKLTLVEPVE